MFDEVDDLLVRADRRRSAVGSCATRCGAEQLDESLVTVHPLGGCGMGESADGRRGRSPRPGLRRPTGDDVYESLYVMDGSVVPVSLGVNPLLTISGLAERSCELLCRDRGLDLRRLARPTSRSSCPTADVIGLRFTETMRGSIRLAGAGRRTPTRRSR